VAAVFATTAVTVAYTLAPGFAAWVALRAVWGGLWSFLRLGGFLAALAAGHLGRGYALGFYNGVANLGTLLAMAAGGWLTDTIGLDPTLWLFAALALPAGLAMLRQGRGEDDRPAAPAAGAPAVVHAPALERWGAYAAALVTGTAGSPLVLSSLGLLIVQRHGESIGVGGLVLGAATLNGALLAVRFAIQPFWGPLAGHLSDRLGRLGFAGVAGLLEAAAMVGLSFPGPLAWTVAMSVVVFVAGLALRVSADALAGDAAPPGARAQFMGWYSNAADFGSALGPLLAFPLASALGLEDVYRLGAAFLLIAGGAVLLVLRQGPRRVQER
jgi:predicted MFS family arabinose efflux permease